MQIIGEYVGMCCFCSWFISCKNLNPIATTKVVAPFVLNNEKGTSLYDLMEIDDCFVKEQLNHYKIMKVCDDEGKDSLAWWKLHEGQFSYVAFLAW